MILPIGSEEDKRWVPEVFNDLTPSEKQGIIRSYYSSVEYMDRNVGLLLEELDRLELSENTLVVFVGDHGYLLNHHRRFEKHMMWEESVTTPLIIRGYRKGALVQAPVELADLTPTMLTALGIELTEAMHGKPLQGLLEGTENTHREYTFSEYLTDNKAMITDGTWKYIFSSGKRDLGSGYATGLGASGIVHRLYNRERDPNETKNLAELAEYQSELDRLQKALVQRFRETHPNASKISSQTTLEDQLIQFCEPPEGEDVGSF
jgi:choline-sulfatase